MVDFFAFQLLKGLLFVGYDLLDTNVRDFMREHLFERAVDLDDAVIPRNLSEPAVAKLLFDHFRASINALTIRDSGSSRIEGHIRLHDTCLFRTEPRGFLPARKSLSNRVVGEANADRLELAFAACLDDAPDVQSFGKNYLVVGFKLDYVKANGELSTYTPDFSCAPLLAPCGWLRPRTERNWICRKKWRGSRSGARVEHAMGIRQQ